MTGEQGQAKHFGRIDIWVNNTVVALFGRLEETVREVRRCIRLRIASAWETGLRHRNSSSGYGLCDPSRQKIGKGREGLRRRGGSEVRQYLSRYKLIVGSASLPVGLLVVGLEERHGQIGYVALAGVFGEVAVC